jgi:hypothetical protein
LFFVFQRGEFLWHAANGQTHLQILMRLEMQSRPEEASLLVPVVYYYGFLGFTSSGVKKMLPGEITGIRDLLSRLENDVVYALADTATKRALAFTSVNGWHHLFFYYKEIYF